MAIAIAGCGGGGTIGANTAVSAGANTVPATDAAAAAWKALQPKIAVQSVTIAASGPARPVVNFTVTDAAGKPITGLANYSQASTATVKGLTNVSFTLAKLVPAANGEPSKWVSYNVIKRVTVAQAAGTVAANASCNNVAAVAATASAPAVPAVAPTWCGTWPSTDAQGTLVDNGDGSYQYTFDRDVGQVAAIVASLNDSTADTFSKKSDLGDVSYNPALTHRLGIQLGGAAPGTGNNTPNAVTNAAYPGVNMVNTANAVFDFRPDGGAIANTRTVVSIENCGSCHQSTVLAHGSRKDPNYCVTCHTDQVKFSINGEATPVGDLTLTGTTNFNTSVVSGQSLADFPNMIHKIHMGKLLVKQGYNFIPGSKGIGLQFNKLALPQDVRNCATCHTASTKTVDGDNWKNVPSILACGSCHDGINFATGLGITLADRDKDVAAKVAVGTTKTGHLGGTATNATCAGCHKTGGMADIAVSHRTDYATPHNPAVPTGLKNFKYEIQSADATATDVKVVFKITMDGTPITFLPAANGMKNPLTGFKGAPGFLMAYAKAQDGVTTPIDYNNLGNGASNAQPGSVSIASLLDPLKATTAGTLAGPDTNGYYTATIVGATTSSDGLTTVSNIFPDGAVLRTVALQSYFEQTTAPGTDAKPIGRHTLSVVKTVGTDAVRRSVIDPNKCGNCHEVFEGHGGQRNIGLGSEGIVVCVVCHNPGLVTSGRGMPDATLANWKFTTAEDAIVTGWGVVKNAVNGALGFPQVSNNLKDMIHGIHAGKDRTDPIAIARNRGAVVTLNADGTYKSQGGAITLIDGNEISFPGILNNCESCHKAGTYSAVPANTLVSTFEANIAGGNLTPANAVTALKQPNADDKVTTPLTAACVSCHDTAAAQSHMVSNGGQILVARSVANRAGEACAVCHGAGKAVDVVAVHK